MRLTKLQTTPQRRRRGGGAMRGFRAVLRKEWLQMTRDRTTLIFALLVPVFELVLFGVIDTNVRHVPTVVFDQSRTAESRAAGRRTSSTLRTSSPARRVASRAELQNMIVAGEASVGIEIPPDYARRRLAGEPADFLVLIDGSDDSSISSQALAAANGARAVALARRARCARAGMSDLPLHAASAAALQPRLAQRQPAHPRPDRRSCSPSRARSWRPSRSCASASAARSSSSW